jgi:threonine aldolase
MIFVDVDPAVAAAFAAQLSASGVLITGTTHQRWVTHLDVTRDDVSRAIACVDAFFAGRR